MEKIILMDTFSYYEAGVFSALEYSIFESDSQDNIHVEWYEKHGSIEKIMEHEDISGVEVPDFHWQDMYEVEKQDVLHLLKQLNAFAFVQLSTRSSHYGAIGGNGATGFRVLEDKENFFNVECDDIIVYIQDNVLHANYYDHDGTHHTTLGVLTENQYHAYQQAESGYDYGFSDKQLDRYYSQIEKKKPLKITNKNLKGVGIL